MRKERMAREMPVVIEPIAGSGYRATGAGGLSVGLSADGATAAEAIDRLADQVRLRVDSGGSIAHSVGQAAFDSLRSHQRRVYRNAILPLSPAETSRRLIPLMPSRILLPEKNKRHRLTDLFRHHSSSVMFIGRLA
jgi:hypothetical protein